MPQLPSPLLYGGVLYMVNDNGIVTTLNPETGALIKQGRLTGAPGRRISRRRSPPTATSSSPAKRARSSSSTPGGDLTPIAVNDLGEDAYATPAFADGRIYVRTVAALYAFGAS